MKLTESQIRKLVQEEIDQMIADGDLDEGIFGGLGQLAKRGVEKAKAAGKSIAKTYKAGSLASDLGKGVIYMNGLIKRAEKMLPEMDPEVQPKVKKAIAGIKSGVTAMNKWVEPLKTMEE